MNSILGTRFLARSLGLLALAALACTASLINTTTPVRAQLGSGSFWLFQPHLTRVVGRAYVNSTRTVEYWAYVAADYEFASSENTSSNRWELDAEATSGSSYGSYQIFKDAVLGMSEFAGKSVIFQNHSMTEETVQN